MEHGPRQLTVAGVSFEWSGLGFFGLFAAAVAIAMGILVLRTAPSRSANQRLAAVLVAEGLTIGTLNGVMLFFSDPTQIGPVLSVGLAALLALPILYIWFLGTLPGRVFAALRHPAASRVLAGGALAAGMYGLLRTEDFLYIVVDPDGNGGPEATLWFIRAQYTLATIYVVGFVAALHAHREASSPISRDRARAFALAFGTRDVLFALNVLYIAFVLPKLLTPEGEPTVSPDLLAPIFGHGTIADLLTQYFAPPFIVLVYVPLMAYGILRSQLFDIDLKIKWAISRTAMGAIFLATFLAATNITAEYLSAEYGYLGGGAAAGLLIFALHPLQRAAERVATKAVPTATGSPEYVTFKKFEVYRAAFEGVLEDGRVNAKERLMLVTLREKLGIREDDANALEADVLGTQPRGAIPA